jgi:hypothetical protein
VRGTKLSPMLCVVFNYRITGRFPRAAFILSGKRQSTVSATPGIDSIFLS